MGGDERILDEWLRAKALFHFPALAPPRSERAAGGARFDFRTNRASLDPARAAEVAQAAGCTEPAALRSLATLAIAQYMSYPRRLSSLLLLFKFVQDFRQEDDPPEFASIVFRSFCDLAAGEACRRREDVGEAYAAALETCAAGLSGAEARLQQLVLDRLRRRRPSPLDEIDLSDAARDVEAVRLGCLTWVAELRDQRLIQGVAEEAAQAAGGGPMGDNISGTPSQHLLDEIQRAPRRRVDDALAELSDRLTRGEFRQLEQVIREFRRTGDAGTSQGDGAKSFGIGTSGGQLVVRSDVVDYYRGLAKNYPLAISHRLVESVELFSSMGATEKFRMGSDPNLMLPFSSGGRILPGLTRKVKVTHSPRIVRRRRFPHALLVVDSSASMPDPDQSKSVMVLAAFCAALSYYKLGASLGVVNFSRDSFYLEYTRDLDAVFGALVAYQSGGTILDIDLIQRMLTKEAIGLKEGDPEDTGYPVVDVLVFTDLGIHNLEELSSLVAERGFVSRVTVITDEALGERRLDPKIHIYENVKASRDIIGITIGEVQETIDHVKAGPTR